MKPAAFAYHRARSVDEAVDLLATLGEGAKVIAGGQSLVPMMNLRLARPTALVDVGRLAELDYVQPGERALHVGALTRHAALERPTDGTALTGFGVVRQAAGLIGHLPIRTMGTVGGSLAHADAAAEWCLLAVLLDAHVRVRGPGGDREVDAQQFFQGFLTTALEPDEVVVEIVFPGPVPHAAVREYARRTGDFALVLAGAALVVDGDRIERAGIAVGGVDAVPIRLPAVEAALVGATVGQDAFAEAGALAAAAVDPADDAHASATYRRHLTAALVRAALADAAEARP